MQVITKLPQKLPESIPRKRVAAYARVSMETDLLLHSLAAQVDYYSHLINSNPQWEYAGVYADSGISGTSEKNRDDFRRLMEDCDAGKIDIVLVKSISRFARNTVDCLKAIRHLKNIGVEIRFEREGISTLDTNGEVLVTLVAAFAQAESESISANVKWAIRKGFQQGIPNSHKAPYGYRWDGEKYRVIPEEGKVVKTIFQRYLSGVPAYSIAKELNECGISLRSGNPVRDDSVKDIVTNISYTGAMLLQKNFITENHTRKRNRGQLNRYLVNGMFEPIVSEEEFNAALETRRKRSEMLPATTRTKFSGLVKCGCCGSGVSRRTSGRIKRWVCNTRERKGMKQCDMRPLVETELEKAAISAFGEMPVDEFRAQVGRIIIFGDRVEFLLSNGKRKRVEREYGGYKARNGFSGRLVCGICGAKLERDTIRSIHSWGCTTLRSACSLKRIKENELRQAAGKALSTKDCEPAFVERVKQAVVYNDHISFEFKDGTVKTWTRE